MHILNVYCIICKYIVRCMHRHTCVHTWEKCDHQNRKLETQTSMHANTQLQYAHVHMYAHVTHTHTYTYTCVQKSWLIYPRLQALLRHLESVQKTTNTNRYQLKIYELNHQIYTNQITNATNHITVSPSIITPLASVGGANSSSASSYS